MKTIQIVAILWYLPFIMPLSCMNNDTTIGDVNCAELNPLAVIPDFIVNYYSSFLDHTAICSFSLVNKEYNQKIIMGKEERKKLFHGTLPLTKNYSFTKVIWHKYGSACAIVTQRDYSSSHLLSLKCIQLKGHTIFKKKSSLFQHFYKFFHSEIEELPHKPFPFFDKEKNILYFYGREKITIFLSGGFAYKKNITRYSIDGSALSCYLQETDDLIPLSSFVKKNPEKLKDILASENFIHEKKDGKLIFYAQ